MEGMNLRFQHLHPIAQDTASALRQDFRRHVPRRLARVLWLRLLLRQLLRYDHDYYSWALATKSAAPHAAATIAATTNADTMDTRTTTYHHD